MSKLSFEDLVSYLTMHGWSSDIKGPAGSVWRHRNSQDSVAVLDDLSDEMYEWRSTLERIANAMHLTVEQVESDIATMYIDVQEFRAANDLLIRGSIPMEAGFTLFSTARTIARAAASTSRSNKMRIGGNYGKAALRIAKKARFGHTIDGSYIVPLLVPLERPKEPVTDTPLEFEGEGVKHPLVEPEERRMTRTLAQALTAIQHGIIEPAREPQGSIISDLVTSGVSREMVEAIERIVREDSVGIFNVSFKWARAFEPPPGNLKSISVPSESAELLRMTAERMKTDKRSEIETVTGQIIDLEDDPETTGGRARIRTIRRGRQTRIDIALTEKQTEAAHSWFSEHRHVAVAGIVKSSPGQVSRIDKVGQFTTLDELVLFNDADSEQ